MFISEIFYSIQGEGSLTGVPSVFVRTSGCNLRCVWCDTPYASWRPEGDELSVDEVFRQIEDFKCRHVVLTGGEPMIARGIHDLAGRLRDAGYHITIETAGTVMPDGIACDLASLSPKLAHSTPSQEQAGAWAERHEARRLQPNVLKAWLEHYEYQLKFVVANEADLQEILDLLSMATAAIPPDRVLLMPEGVDVATLAGRRVWLVEACKRYGFRYCQRLHIDLFGNTRAT